MTWGVEMAPIASQASSSGGMATYRILVFEHNTGRISRLYDCTSNLAATQRLGIDGSIPPLLDLHTSAPTPTLFSSDTIYAPSPIPCLWDAWAGSQPASQEAWTIDGRGVPPVVSYILLLFLMYMRSTLAGGRRK